MHENGRNQQKEVNRKSKFRPTLRVRLLLLIGSASLIILLAATLLSLNYQRQELIESARISTTALSNAIEANLRHAMLTVDRGLMDETVQTIVAEGAVKSLRILDDQGFVRVSSIDGEVGTPHTQMEALCQSCHLNNTSPIRNNIVFTADDGRESLLNVNSIQNQPGCYSCHSPENQTLGLMMIETPLSPIFDQLKTSFWRTTVIAFVSLLLLIGIIVPSLNRDIVRPIKVLTRGVAEISAGNLDYQVSLNHQDEFNELAESFDGMRKQLKASTLEMERRYQELSLLNEIGLSVGQSLELKEVLNSALKIVSEKLDVEAGFIFLRDDALGRYNLCASIGASAELCQEIEKRRMMPAYNITDIVVQSDRPVYIPDISTDSRLEGLWDDLHGRSYINVPLKAKGNLIGTMSLVSPVGKPLPERSVTVAESVGSQLGMLIENAQLYQRLRYMAVLEERDRLARAMHDDLAQSLGYLNVKASITYDLIMGELFEQARESLQELKTVAKVVYTDVREAIFNLRTSVSMQEGFIPTLKEYLEEYRTNYQLNIELLVGYQYSAELLPEVANQVIRIVQEALTNVRKHAKADKVWVRCIQNSHHVCVTVEDNGLGFDPLQLHTNNRQHIGLQVMRERAESIGGRLEFDTQPGQGTRVTVWAPL
jgi:nitrate/nitrite-specific signal transduction histidine kinase